MFEHGPLFGSHGRENEYKSIMIGYSYRNAQWSRELSRDHRDMGLCRLSLDTSPIRRLLCPFIPSSALYEFVLNRKL